MAFACDVVLARVGLFAHISRRAFAVSAPGYVAPMQCMLSPGPKSTEHVLSLLDSLRVASIERHELSEGFTLFVLDDGAICEHDRDLVKRCCWMTTLEPPVLDQYLSIVKRGSPPLVLFPGHL